MLKCKCGGEIRKYWRVSEVYKYDKEEHDWIFIGYDYEGDAHITFHCNDCGLTYTADEVQKMASNLNS